MDFGFYGKGLSGYLHFKKAFDRSTQRADEAPVLDDLDDDLDDLDDLDGDLSMHDWDRDLD